MEMIFMNTENSKFVLNMPQSLNLKSSKKTCCPSKLIYLSHLEKYKKTVEKQ